jgi:serine/threonine-protein kinase
MEYLRGESLAERINTGGALSPEDVATVVDHVARALTEAHARGIVHRDVKPENIILVEDGEHGFSAKLIDFGLAKPQKESAGTVAAGTPNYMSPEHLHGAPPSPALDIWGLAATAFCAMTNQTPFDGDTLADVFKVVCNDPLPIPSNVNPRVPPGFDDWFARACSRIPAGRFQTATDLSAALSEICRGHTHARSDAVPRATDADDLRTRILEDTMLLPGSKSARGEG